MVKWVATIKANKKEQSKGNANQCVLIFESRFYKWVIFLERSNPQATYTLSYAAYPSYRLELTKSQLGKHNADWFLSASKMQPAD